MLLPLLAVALPVAAATCDPVPPQGFLVAVGTARGRQAEATVAALEIARTRLVAQLCEGQVPARCAALRPHVRDWAPTWDEPSATACALAAIEAARVDAALDEALALDRALAGLAAQVRQHLGTLPLRVEAAPSASARRVAALLHLALAAQGGVALAEGEADAGRLGLGVDVGARETVVAATLTLPGAAALPIGGFTVSNEALGVQPGDTGADSGADTGELTLVVSARKDKQVELRSGDSITAGDQVTVTVTVDQPAFLYLVYDDGGGKDVLLSRDGLYAPAGTPVRLPQPGRVLQVDDEAGKTEHLTVIATRQPLPSELTGSGEVAVAVRRLRGFDLVAEGEAESEGEGVSGAQPSWLSDPLPVVSGYGAAVYTLRLEHR